MRRLRAIAVLALLLHPADASVIHKTFAAVLDSGDYAGTHFSGSFAYDNSGTTGVGTEYLALTGLRFTLLGTAFGEADIDQGGQVILQNGVFYDFTAAIFPPTPWPSPVSDIAFGFGGQGVIGYIGPSDQIGLGHYTVASATAAEPPAMLLFAAGVGGLMCSTAMAKRRSRPSGKRQPLPVS